MKMSKVSRPAAFTLTLLIRINCIRPKCDHKYADCRPFKYMPYKIDGFMSFWNFLMNRCPFYSRPDTKQQHWNQKAVVHPWVFQKSVCWDWSLRLWELLFNSVAVHNPSTTEVSIRLVAWHLDWAVQKEALLLYVRILSVESWRHFEGVSHGPRGRGSLSYTTLT